MFFNLTALLLISALACGTLFGLGLAISHMWSPNKVLDFLDITGSWDASLLLVLGSAVTVATLGFRILQRCKKPLFDAAFEKPPVEHIDLSLVIGSAIFGIGWGICGYCPGPAIATLARSAPNALAFTAAFAAGSLGYRYARSCAARRSKPS